MSEKLFTLAGTSVTPAGVKTMRFATGKAKTREGVLKRNKHTEVVFHELPNEMLKADAAAWLRDEKGVTDAVLPAGRTTKEAPTTAERAAELAEAKKVERKAKDKARRDAKKVEKAKTSPAPAANEAPQPSA